MTGKQKAIKDALAPQLEVSPAKRWTISLQMLLSISFGGLVFLAVATVLGFSIYSNYTNTVALLNQRSVQLLDSMEREIRSETGQAESAISGLALSYADGLFGVSDEISIRERLTFILRVTPVIEMLHVIDTNGNSIGMLRKSDGSMIGDPVMGEMDIDALLKGARPDTEKPVWGEPQVINNTLFHNVYLPLVRNGLVEGIVVASVGRTSMNRIITNLGVANETTAFVLNAENEVIAHSKLPNFFYGKAKSPLNEFPDKILQKITTAEPISNDSTNPEITILDTGDRRNGYIFLTKKLAGYSRAPYTLGAWFSKYDALDEIRHVFMSAMVGLMALIISIVAAVLLARRIARPLGAVSRVAGKFTRFEIDDIEPLPPSRVSEINEQITAINSVRTAMSEFSHYVPKSLVSRLVKTGTDATRSIEREVTILFSDIVGFTSLSELLDATETANLLNEHFELVCTEIDTCEGTVDKFMGDGIMAYWGAPELDMDHADHAFKAATNIARALKKDNETRRRQGKQPLQLRVGIHTGVVVVGNIGGGDRRNFTIIGDAVNVTQRLEQMGKELIGDEEIIILASSTAKQAASKRFQFESVGTRTLRGRENPISIFAFQPDLGAAAE